MTTLPLPPSPHPARAPADDPRWFVDDFAQFAEASRNRTRDLPLDWDQRQPHLADRTPRCDFDRHYIYHTAWAARVLAETRPARHVDISSTLYFAAIASAFVPVDYHEYRPVNIELANLTAQSADLLALPFADRSTPSLSCMHVVEHVGLGRYGDAIDPDGDLKAMAELSRVLAPGGSLMFVVPVGRPRVVFNAHRIYGVEHIRSAFAELELIDFSLIPDGRRNAGLLSFPPAAFVAAQNYGCGCFLFRRSST